MSRLPVKLTEHGTKVTFATTCLHNWIIGEINFALFCFDLVYSELKLEKNLVETKVKI